MRRVYTPFLVVVFVFLSFTLKAQFAKENYNYDSDVKPKDGYTEIYFVGTGDIQLALKEGNNIAANTGLGVLFWRIWNSNIELQLDAKINVASTVDSLFAYKKNGVVSGNRIFGTYLLSPVTNGQGTSLNSLWYLPSVNGTNRWYIDGLQFSGLASNMIWQLNTSINNSSTGQQETSMTSRYASLLFLRAGLFHEFVPEVLRRTKGYSIRVGLNYNFRSIQGDLGRSNNEAFRTDLISTSKKNFHGGEFLLSLRLKNIRADASLPIVAHKTAEPVSGLSGVQFYTTISFVGGFPLSLK